MYKAFLAFFISVLLYAPSYGQQDSLKIKDSLNAGILQQYNNKLAEIETQRKLDSSTNAQLQAQLYTLKLGDSARKEALQKKLSDLNIISQERLAEKKRNVDSLRHTAISYPVLGFFQDTLFQVYDKLGSFSASERAAAITQRINKLGGQFPFRPDSVKLQAAETAWDIVYGESIIMTVTENDALWNDATAANLAPALCNHHKPGSWAL